MILCPANGNASGCAVERARQIGDLMLNAIEESDAVPDDPFVKFQGMACMF